MADERCPKCNAIMFEVQPFKTTQKEMVDFATHSSLSENEKQSIIQSKWMHPGSYCPNDCTKIFVDGPLPLPAMTIDESITIATEHAHKHLKEFLQTHGAKSRIVACVYCKKFEGAILEGESPTALYYRAQHIPFRIKKAIFVHCSDLRIQKLKNQFWYTTGRAQAECAYFEYDEKFKWVYKEVTGWSEYPVS